MQSARYPWIGGPRPPTAANLRRSGVGDDFDFHDFSDTVIDPSVFAAVLSENRSPEESPQAGYPVKAVRRRAIDVDTEHRWLLMLDASRTSQPNTPSSASSTNDSRWKFFGPRPREQRRTPRSSPLTPHTPYSPFTPYTPDSPELETPADDIPGSHVSQNYSESDPDSKGLRGGREFLITPFLLRHPSTTSFAANEDLASTETSNSKAPLPVGNHPVIAPLAPLRHVDGTRSRNTERSSDLSTVLGSPISLSQSEHSQPRNSTRSSRPVLSIITSASWSKERQVPAEPVPLLPNAPQNPPSVAGQLTQMLVNDVLRNLPKYKALLAYRGGEAQQILDCLQVVLDSPSLRGHDRTNILKALTRLSGLSGLYPRCFQLHGVEIMGTEAIDEGRYGDVWKAKFQKRTVCLKILRTYQRMPTQPLLKNLSNEALLWGQLSHPNILPFYGIHINEVRRSRFGLVSPWMENGNIVGYLKRNLNVSRIPLLHDIASGLQYLHSMNIVHGDIKGTNILVTSAGRACLADFGLSTLLGDNVLSWSSLDSGSRSGGTTRWRAPELFLQDSMDNDLPPTPASDVYSLACVAYEMLTGLIPFHNIKKEGYVIIAKIFNKNLQPTRPPVEEAGKEMTDELWQLLEECWALNPGDRPSLADVLRRLEAMMTPEQVQAARNGNACEGACQGSDQQTVLSSSSFRTSFKGDDVPSDEDLLEVVSMISR